MSKAIILILLATFFLCYGCEVYEKAATQGINGWEKADKKWEEFKEHYLKSVHVQEMKTPAYKHSGESFLTVFEEVKSPLIQKFFPDHKIFRAQPAEATSQPYGAFAISKDGVITDISDGWSAQSEKDDFRNPNYVRFLQSQNITIENERDAAQLIQLTEPIDIRGSLKHYKYKAFKQDDNSWYGYRCYGGNFWLNLLGRIPFIGRSSCGIMPTKWVIVLNEEKQVVDFYHSNEFEKWEEKKIKKATLQLTKDYLINNEFRLFSDVFAAQPTAGYPVTFLADGKVVSDNIGGVTHWRIGEDNNLQLLSDKEVVLYNFVYDSGADALVAIVEDFALGKVKFFIKVMSPGEVFLFEGL